MTQKSTSMEILGTGDISPGTVSNLLISSFRFELQAESTFLRPVKNKKTGKTDHVFLQLADFPTKTFLGSFNK